VLESLSLNIKAWVKSNRPMVRALQKIIRAFCKREGAYEMSQVLGAHDKAVVLW